MKPSRSHAGFLCRAASLALLLAFLAGGCAGAPAAQPPAASPAPAAGPRRGGTLRMSLSSDIQSWDPIVATQNPTIWTMLLIYDQIVRVAPDGRGVEPALAERYAISADGTTYTFTMRQGVTFHDGTPLAIEDLRYAIERGSSAESPWRPLLPPITRIATPDARTLVVELAEPWAPFLADLALYAFSVIPRREHQQRGTAWFEKPVGTGPFMLEQWRPGSTVLLKRNPTFWDARYPFLDGVELRILPDDSARLLEFQAGGLDIANELPFNQIAALRGKPGAQVLGVPLLGIDLISINHRRPPFDERNVRMAVNMAIDRAAIVRSVLFGQGAVASSALPPMLYWSELVQAYPYDPAAAKALLAQSSRPGGFATTLLIHAGNTVERAVATIVQDQLRQIGIALAISEADTASVAEQAASGAYDLFYGSLTSDIIDPDELAAIPLAPSGGLNALFTGYKNADLDALIRRAARTPDAAERGRLYAQMQQVFRDDAVFVPLFYPHSRAAAQPYVRGFTILPTANYRLWETWLER